MFKKFLASVREFKTPTILTLIFIIAEVIIEVFIPFVTAFLISYIQTPSVDPLAKIPFLAGIIQPSDTLQMPVILGSGSDQIRG